MRRSRIYLDSGKYTEAEADLNQRPALPQGFGRGALFACEGRPGPRECAEPEAATARSAQARSAPFWRLESIWPGHCSPPGAPQPALTLLDEAPENQMDAAPLDPGSGTGRSWRWRKKADARKGVDRRAGGGQSVPEGAPAGCGHEARPERLRRGPEVDRRGAWAGRPRMYAPCSSWSKAMRRRSRRRQAVQIMREYAPEATRFGPRFSSISAGFSQPAGTAPKRAKAFEAAKADETRPRGGGFCPGATRRRRRQAR